jgi:hypothetical protein
MRADRRLQLLQRQHLRYARTGDAEALCQIAPTVNLAPVQKRLEAVRELQRVQKPGPPASLQVTEIAGVYTCPLAHAEHPCNSPTRAIKREPRSPFCENGLGTVNAGELPAFKIRGQWRIRRTELERWMDEQPRGGGDDDALTSAAKLVDLGQLFNFI